MNISNEFRRKKVLLKKYREITPMSKWQFPWSVDDLALLKDYLRVKSELNRVPTNNEMKKYSSYAINTYRNHFGSYQNFLKIIEEPPPTGSKISVLKTVAKTNPSPYELISYYRALAKKLGRPPTEADIDAQGIYTSLQYQKTFINFNNLKKWI